MPQHKYLILESRRLYRYIDTILQNLIADSIAQYTHASDI